MKKSNIIAAVFALFAIISAVYAVMFTFVFAEKPGIAILISVMSAVICIAAAALNYRENDYAKMISAAAVFTFGAEALMIIIYYMGAFETAIPAV